MLTLKVVGLACASELRPWLVTDAAVIVLAKESLLLDGEGGDAGDEGGEAEGVTVTVVAAGGGGDSGGVEEVVTVARVVDM